MGDAADATIFPMGRAAPLPPPGFDETSVEDKIEYVQALWDRIAANESQVRIPFGTVSFFTSALLTIRQPGPGATLGRGGSRSPEATGMTRLIVRPAAEADILDAQIWYSTRDGAPAVKSIAEFRATNVQAT